MWRFNFEYLFLTLKLCFDAMARLGWSSAPEAKLINKMSTKNNSKLNCHMLQTLTFFANSEVLIMFTGQTTSKSGLWRIQFNHGKKFCDIYYAHFVLHFKNDRKRWNWILSIIEHISLFKIWVMRKQNWELCWEYIFVLSIVHP